MKALELTEPATDATILFEMGADGVSGRVVHRGVFCELEVIARLVDSVAELLVAARDESVIKEAHVFEDGSADEQTAGRRELLVCKVGLDGKASMVVVSGREWWVGGWCELDVAAHIVGVGGLDGFERGFEPVFGDGHVGVDEGEDVAVGVSDSSVAGGIRGLDLAFVTEGYVVVVFFVALNDFGGSVGGVVVDEDMVRAVGRLDE